MCRNTHPPLNIPHLDFSIHAPTENVLTGMTPVETRNPAGVPTEVCDLLTRTRVIERDDSSVPSCCEECGTGREFDRADWLYKTWEGV